MRKRVTGKKAVALVMASLMIASMAGCGSSGSESSGSGNTSVKEKMEVLILPSMK